jgi:phosphogluconate dehydratase
MLIGALSFVFLPFVFVPAGPMPTGLSNKEKAAVRQRYAEGKASRDELLESESASYHAPGTCTFYGTANSNQMLMEVMGLHLPGASFVNPGMPLRAKLTDAAARQVVKMTAPGGTWRPLCNIVCEKSIVNALVALLATGGSTNHTMHWVAIAKAAGILINWDDFAELSAVVPSVTQIYPNGQADINHFQAAGGTALLIRDLLENGLLHEDVKTILGTGLSAYTREPFLQDGELSWREGVPESLDLSVLRPVRQPFAAEGGLKVVSGNLGRGVIKVSAVKPAYQQIEAEAVVLQDQDELEAKFEAGELNKDCVVVVRFQGPKANGMPELHKLTPYLGVLQDRGYQVALVTDGRMSGASGKVPAAIQVYPEAVDGGMLAKVRDGDRIRIDAMHGALELLVPAEELAARPAAVYQGKSHQTGLGRELFAVMRQSVSNAESGALTLMGL